ncbi:MAG: RluA family pseudouridine synthase [Candidatus Lernaella stagnicola]|nr:RluA family pseudouridine synthase [Candidatus Lernaella stagnicola]
MKHLPKTLIVSHEDEDIIVVDKPAGLLTMDTDRHTSRTVYFYLTDYVRKGNSRSRKRIFIVHRLDRDASGLLVFAKTEFAKRQLQDHWQDAIKKYLAVVHGRFEKQTGTIESYLAESKAFRVYSTPEASKGRLARTGYTVLRETAHLSLLEINLITGRKHQIRVHMADSGHAIVGDKKYGKKIKGHARLALHAFSLTFRHPATGEMMTFETKTPDFVGKLVRA